MGCGAARQETFGQWNEAGRRRRARSGRGNSSAGIGKWLLNPDTCGPGKHPPSLVELIISGILQENPDKIRLRTENIRSYSDVEGIERAFTGIDRIVASITDVTEVGHAYAHRLREQRNLIRRDDKIRSADPAIDHPVQERSRSIQRLPDLCRSLQPVRCVGLHAVGLLIKSGEAQSKILGIEPARFGEADQGQFFQVAVTSLERDRVVPPAEVEAGNIKGNPRANAGFALRG